MSLDETISKGQSLLYIGTALGIAVAVTWAIFVYHGTTVHSGSLKYEHFTQSLNEQREWREAMRSDLRQVKAELNQTNTLLIDLIRHTKKDK